MTLAEWSKRTEAISTWVEHQAEQNRLAYMRQEIDFGELRQQNALMLMVSHQERVKLEKESKVLDAPVC